jgi:hypothetical protein
MKYQYILTVILIQIAFAIYSTNAQVTFVTDIEDYNLNCSLPASAGTLVGLVFNQTTSKSYVAKFDISEPQVKLFLFPGAEYDNFYDKSPCADPVRKQFSLLSSINSVTRLITYDTINGSLVSDVAVSSSVINLAFDVIDAQLYAFVFNETRDINGTFISSNISVAKLNYLTGDLFDHIYLDASYLNINVPRITIDHRYIFIGDYLGEAYVYSVNVNTSTYNKTILSMPNNTSINPLFVIGDRLYSVIVDYRESDVKKIGVIYIYNSTFELLSDSPNAADLYSAYSVDETRDEFYGTFDTLDKIYTYNLTDGSVIRDSLLPEDLSLQNLYLEQACICCILEAQQSQLTLQTLTNPIERQYTTCALQTSPAGVLALSIINLLSLLMTGFALIGY